MLSQTWLPRLSWIKTLAQQPALNLLGSTHIKLEICFALSAAELCRQPTQQEVLVTLMTAHMLHVNKLVALLEPLLEIRTAPLTLLPENRSELMMTLLVVLGSCFVPNLIRPRILKSARVISIWSPLSLLIVRKLEEIVFLIVPTLLSFAKVLIELPLNLRADNSCRLHRLRSPKHCLLPCITVGAIITSLMKNFIFSVITVKTVVHSLKSRWTL